MKKLLVILACAMAPFAHAQKVEQTTMDIILQCFALSDFTRVLDMYDEEPMFSMDTIVKQDGKQVKTQTVFTLNIQTRAWTMYRQVDRETVCVHAAGENFDFMAAPVKPNL